MYRPTIGIEVHAELKTERKMFCNCKNPPFDAEPNTYVCPICLAHPGALPTINKDAVESIIRLGLAIGGKIANFSEFDRKNYFYPDLPKGYQISQYKYPIVSGGEIAGVKITRVHLEEDTAKLAHEGDRSIIDFNRSSVPLMELVTEPVIHSSEEAYRFAKELQLLLRTLGISDADMEKGQMRVEANVSVSKGDSLGIKVEVKNINSFRAVKKAIEYEIKRQIEVLESGGEVVQETRGWDENKEVTFSQRKKEVAQEYRYFPEPDLPKMFLYEVFDLESLKEKLPELPWEKREKLKGKVNDEYVETIVQSEVLYDLFKKVSSLGEKKAKVILNTILNDAKDLALGIEFGDEIISAFEKVADAFLGEKISSNALSKIIVKLLKEPKNIGNIDSLISENEQISDENQLKEIVKKVIESNKKVVEEYKKGKEKAFMFLVGQVMKETRGKANPKLVSEILKSEILCE